MVGGLKNRDVKLVEPNTNVEEEVSEKVESWNFYDDEEGPSKEGRWKGSTWERVDSLEFYSG